MITKTCLTGGGFEEEPCEEGPEEPPSEPDEPDSEPEEPDSEPEELLALLPEDALAGAGVEAGVEEDSEAGAPGVGVASPVDGGEDEGVVLGAEAVVCGSRTFSGALWEASVSFTRGPAAPPISTPKPRNMSTSSADTRGAGRLRPDPRGARLGAAGAAGCGSGPRTSAACASRRFCSSATSSGLRAPTRAPQAMQYRCPRSSAEPHSPHIADEPASTAMPPTPPKR